MKSRGYFLPHRVLAALAAIWERLRGLNAAALAIPSLRPPMRPKATVWGFLGVSTGGSVLGAWPVASRIIWKALWAGSRGRGSRIFDRSGMTVPVWQGWGRNQAPEFSN